MTKWFFDTAGIGSVMVFALGISVFIAYFRMLRWIQTTPHEPVDPAAVNRNEGDEQAK